MLAVSAAEPNRPSGAIVSTTTPPVGAPIDANGNLTADGSRTFEWDARNQLVAVNVGTHRSEFSYDGEQRRVQIVEKEGGVTQSDTKVVWCDEQICEERAADGTTVTRRAFGVGEQVAGSARFFAADHLGSVTEVADASATLLGRYAFDPWGRRTLTAGSDVTSEGFTGHRWQASGSILLTQYRAYDSELGRWLSEDPIAADGPNLYAYVSGNPVLWADPDGLQRRRCTARVYAVLRAAVLATCKTPTSCSRADSCTLIKLKILTKRMCIAAQTALTKACFPNDRTHQQRIEDEKRGIKRCQDILAEKEKNCECK